MDTISGNRDTTEHSLIQSKAHWLQAHSVTGRQNWDQDIPAATAEKKIVFVCLFDENDYYHYISLHCYCYSLVVYFTFGIVVVVGILTFIFKRFMYSVHLTLCTHTQNEQTNTHKKQSTVTTHSGKNITEYGIVDRKKKRQQIVINQQKHSEENIHTKTAKHQTKSNNAEKERMKMNI